MTSQSEQTNQIPMTVLEKSMINSQSELKKLCSEKLGNNKKKQNYMKDNGIIALM